MARRGTSKRLGYFISIILIAAICLFAVSFIFARIFGAGAYAVTSGSMEPAYDTGSLIYLKDVDTNQLKKGDVITFAQAENMVVTHRITKVTERSGELWFITKGDANDTTDASPVYYKNVIGSPAFQIPLIGYVVTFAKQPPGIYLVIALIVLLVVLSVMPMLGRRKEKTGNVSNAQTAK